MNELLQLPSTIEKITTMSNRTLRLQVDTQENLTDEQVMKVMANHDKLGYFCFLVGENKIEPEMVADLPELPTEKGQKTPAERLRAILWVYWDTKTNKQKASDIFYIEQMELIINKIKEKLDG